MRKLFVLCLLIAAASAATLLAQEEKADIAKDNGNRIMIARRWLLVEFPCGDLKLKGWLFVPRGAENAPTPAVLRIPAGGNLFTPAVLGLGTVPEIEPFVAAGYVTMVMSFRGTLDNPGNFRESRGGLDDVLAALEFLASQPEVDKKNIFIAGHSSAATLSLRAAQISDLPRAVAAFSPVADWAKFYKERMKDVSKETAELVRESSPITHTAKIKCPALITHGTDDKIVPFEQSEKLAEKFAKDGKQVDFVKIPFGDHYYSMLKAGVDLSIAYFSEIQRHGKTTDIFEKFRDNLLEKFAGEMKPGEK